MDTLYLISLLVGGFFVLLSLIGGSDSDADVDADLDADFDADADADVDAGSSTDAGMDAGAGPGFVELLTLRALFLFAAFFGLTGLALSWIDAGEPFTAVTAVLTGLVVGLGGNFLIKRVGYAHVSSDIGGRDLKGRTAKVILPFEGAERGKIGVVAKGHRLQLVARAFGEEAGGAFAPGEEVVIVRMDGRVAEVLKPE